MQREDAIQSLKGKKQWDLLIIGGGATGLGTALDAAARGYKTLLVEQSDFAKGTSSRSTKLIHGGVRYLRQGNISLVKESLHERGLLLRNAPDFVHWRDFIVPAYHWWEKPWYATGLKLYDFLAGNLGGQPSRILSREETQDRVPGIRSDGLSGGITYQDGQFDDAGLAIALAEKIFALGGTALNYTRVVRFLKTGNQIQGAVIRDEETGSEMPIHARQIINATGAFADSIRSLDQDSIQPLVAASQGSHIVLPARFMPSTSALMIPRTNDGRILFLIPWNDRLLIGTTDVAKTAPTLEPQPTEDEISFLLNHAADYLKEKPGEADILSSFAGLRPLVRSNRSSSTKNLSRDHFIEVADSGLITIVGGKWTTYRKMAEDTINTAIKRAGLSPRACPTQDLVLEKSRSASTGESKPLHQGLPITEPDVIHASRNQMARTVEDVMARRTRCLLLDARASAEITPRIAGLLAGELNRDTKWINDQIGKFQKLCRAYLPSSSKLP